ncbi:hypothetical protein GE061_014761 [Apolygus lucorum]|uniref:Uncharacterized protein n=1 Tax=Apolygus lucorum TaxID=248454 RepID=A0A8S9XL98_APOLU|nr:hypothetical protein GE061_014761 [Apolygus lucorum]
MRMILTANRTGSIPDSSAPKGYQQPAMWLRSLGGPTAHSNDSSQPTPHSSKICFSNICSMEKTLAVLDGIRYDRTDYFLKNEKKEEVDLSASTTSVDSSI